MKDDIIIAEGFWTGLISRITSKIRVKFIESDLDLNCRALWDTGATQSLVLPKVIKKQKNLKAFNKIKVPFRNDKKFRQYKANLYFSDFSDKICFRDFIMTEYDFSWDEDIVIGMDIIKLGTFIISNDKNRTHFAFMLSKSTIEEIDLGIW